MNKQTKKPQTTFTFVDVTDIKETGFREPKTSSQMQGAVWIWIHAKRAGDTLESCDDSGQAEWSVLPSNLSSLSHHWHPVRKVTPFPFFFLSTGSKLLLPYVCVSLTVSVCHKSSWNVHYGNLVSGWHSLISLYNCFVLVYYFLLACPNFVC